MKIFLFIFSLILSAGCRRESKMNTNETQSVVNYEERDEANVMEEKNDTIVSQKNIILPEITQFPKIVNKKLLMEKLRKIIGLPDIARFRLPVEEILNYRKFSIQGFNARLVLLEYRFADEEDAPLSAFPYKCQFIFKEDGTLLKILYDYKYRFIKIFPNKKPFLITVSSTARGNGRHSVYKYENDSLVNIFDYGYLYIPKTYDAINCESIANIPAELKIMIKDYNKDGFNDLIFTGTIIYDTINMCVADHYDGKEKVKLVFLYNQQQDNFSPIKTFTTIEELLAK